MSSDPLFPPSSYEIVTPNPGANSNTSAPPAADHSSPTMLANSVSPTATASLNHAMNDRNMQGRLKRRPSVEWVDSMAGASSEAGANYGSRSASAGSQSGSSSGGDLFGDLNRARSRSLSGGSLGSKGGGSGNDNGSRCGPHLKTFLPRHPLQRKRSLSRDGSPLKRLRSASHALRANNPFKKFAHNGRLPFIEKRLINSGSGQVQTYLDPLSNLPVPFDKNSQKKLAEFREYQSNDGKMIIPSFLLENAVLFELRIANHTLVVKEVLGSGG